MLNIIKNVLGLSKNEFDLVFSYICITYFDINKYNKKISKFYNGKTSFTSRHHCAPPQIHLVYLFAT